MNTSQNNNRRPRGNLQNANRNNRSRLNNRNTGNNMNGRNYNNYNNYNINSYNPPQPQQRRIKYTVPYQYQRRKRTPFIVKFGARFLLFLFFFVVIGGVWLALFFLNLTRTTSIPEVSYTVNTPQTVNGKEKTVSDKFTVSYDIGFAGNRFYFPINDIMEYMEFIVAGNDTDYSFIRENPKEYIKIKTGTNIVYINDEEFHLTAPSFADIDNKIYVPLDFLRNNFKNLTFTFDEKNKNQITVDVQKIPDGELFFKIRQIKKLEKADEADAPYFSKDPVNFKADLSLYIQYFNPPNSQAEEFVILINQANPLDPQDYIPPDLTDLVDTRKDGRPIQQIRFYPAKSLEAFLIEARANGHANITVTSAYRSYDMQVSIFNTEVDKLRPVHGDAAEELASRMIAYPGHSEHQSGLGVDMHSFGAAAQDFGNQPDGKWLAANAHHFGFILRYPRDKTDITGIQYEPWHFRYVGRYHATKMYDLNLCLEEYHEQILNKD